MNREIKFRVWNGSKMEPQVMAGWLGAFYVAGMDEKDKACMSSFNTIYGELAPVMQYTGLKDKNGVEIYEGDILEEEPGYLFEVVWCAEWAKFKLQWRTKATQYPEWNRGIRMAIIGNIYQNPELLKAAA